MTAAEILVLAADAGIALEARGERLLVDAPVGVLTPELRRQLEQQKPALLALLAPTYVALRGGLVVPADALRLVLDLERRGIPLAVDRQHQFIDPPADLLTPADRAAIARWRAHLAALIEYVAPELS